MKKRNIVLCILFCIITGGIYGIYWFCSVTNATNQAAPNHKSFGGIGSLLLGIITCGIYYLVWAYHLGQKSNEMNGNSGGGALYLVLEIIGLQFVNLCLAQSAINSYVQRPTAAAPLN